MSNGKHKGGFGEPIGGCDAQGNPITVSFGWGSKEGHTLLGDGDRSEINFMNRSNHDHYGPNNNGTERGQYTGYGSKP